MGGFRGTLGAGELGGGGKELKCGQIFLVDFCSGKVPPFIRTLFFFKMESLSQVDPEKTLLTLAYVYLFLFQKDHRKEIVLSHHVLSIYLSIYSF